MTQDTVARRSAAPMLVAILALAACGDAADESRPDVAAGPAAGARVPAAVPTSEAELVALARGIHERIVTIDTHVDIPFDFATPSADPGVRGRFQNDLPKMREGGLDAAFFVVYHGQGERTAAGYAQAYDRAMQKFDGIRRMAFDRYPDQIELAFSADDVERIHGEGKLVALIGVENLYPIGTDLSILDEWYELGARYASLTHNGHNDFGDAAVEIAALGDDGPEWGGLSPLGEAAVDALNRLGIMVDVSHAHRETMLQTVARSRAPVIASHSSIRAVADHPRNLDDEQLFAIRGNGGVAQTTALAGFVRVQPPERSQELAALYLRFDHEPGADLDNLNLSSHERDQFFAALDAIERRYPPASLQDYVDHIDYAVNLIGIDHVGISSDFDGGGGVVGWEDASETFNVTLELVRRGYSEEEIRKLWGGNLLRVMRAVEAAAG